MLVTYKLRFEEIDSLFQYGLYDNRITYVDATNNIKSGFFYSVRQLEVSHEHGGYKTYRNLECPSYDPIFFAGFVKNMISFGWTIHNNEMFISFHDIYFSSKEPENKSVQEIIAFYNNQNLIHIDEYITSMRYFDFGNGKTDYSLVGIKTWSDLFGEFSN